MPRKHNKNSPTENLWTPVKSMLRRKFIGMQAYFKKWKKTNKQPNLTP